MSKRLRVLFSLPVIVLTALLFVSSITRAAPGGRIFKPFGSQAIHFKQDRMEIDVPAGAAENELSIETVEPDLTGIAKPLGFRTVSKIYRFGPSGTKFASGKELDLKISLEEKNREVRLYYINHNQKCLERVANQEFKRETGKLRVKLKHFSDYVLGISSGWDGAGINPFFDITNGDETISASTGILSVRSAELVLPGRGINLALVRAYSQNPTFDCLKISDHWYWDLPYVEYDYSDKRKINIPRKGGCVIGAGDAKDGDVFNISGVYYKAVKENGNYAPLFYLKDGTKVSIDSNQVTTVTDCNGNSYSYGMQQIGAGELYRLAWLQDSLGRYFSCNYNDEGVLESVRQKLKDGAYKTILTYNATDDGDYFTDSLGRNTYYNYNEKEISQIRYPNGARTEYSWGGGPFKNVNSVKEQRFYKPNQTQPFRTVSYTYFKIDSRLYHMIVNDGSKVRKYYCERSGSYYIPYISGESLYSLSGTSEEFICSKSFTYCPDDYDYDMVASISTRLPTGLKAGSVLPGFDPSLSFPAIYKYEYDNWGNITKVTDPKGTKTVMAYANTDCNQTLSANGYQDPLYTTGAAWDRMITKATLVTDAVHGTTHLKQTHYKYDAATGNLLQESEVYNGGYLNTYYTYDSYGNVLTKTDANGNKLCFAYDAAYKSAYLTKVATAGGTTVATYDYDFDTGKKIRATDPKGNVYHYEYDGAGRLTGEYLDNSSSKVAITRKITYDDLNNTVALKFGNTTTGWQEGLITYDPLFGKPTLWQRKVGGDWVTQKRFNYDSSGRLAWKQDGLGHQTTYTYDALDRKTVVTQPNGSTTQYTYTDWIVTITDANGNQTVQNYDMLGRLVSVKETPDSGTTYYTTSYTYDTFNHLVKMVNPKNAATVNTYDNLGRLIRTDYPQDGSNPMSAETFTYDNVSNLLTKTNGKGTKKLTYEYFAGYRLRKVVEADDKTVSYTYDANGNPLSQSTNGAAYNYTYDARNRMTNLKARLDGYTFNIGCDYDTFGRVTALTYPGRTTAVNYRYNDLDLLRSISGFVDSCSYDKDNKLTAMALANGISNTYSYDENNRPTNIAAGNLLNLAYSYDAAGNITRINSDYYGYDGLNRLTWYGNLPYAQKANATGTAWSYDAAGNMTAKATYRKGVSQENVAFSYDLANRLLTMGTAAYSNDNAGARTQKVKAGDTWRYEYDGESRLTRVNKNGTSQVQCAYDGTGMRYKKVENGKTTYYIYSGSNTLVEYSPSNGKYTYRIYAGKRAVAEEVGGVVKFYHKDHLGSTRLVTDAAGKKIAAYKYAPYGELETAAGDGSDYRFTDKATDAGTGLSYFGARYYDPETGRFITQDPAMYGHNWYEYCNNNPVRFIDPFGLEFEDIDYDDSLSYELPDIVVTPDDVYDDNYYDDDWWGDGGDDSDDSYYSSSDRDSSPESTVSVGTIATVTLGEIQYTLDYYAAKPYEVRGYINKAGYIRILPKTEILGNFRLYQWLGKAAYGVAVAGKAFSIYSIVTDKNLSPGQKWGRAGIEIASTVIEYGAGLAVGSLTLISGPGAFVAGAAATGFTSVVLDCGKNFLHEQLGL
jgi:RHS repeat-associated protein